MGFEPVDDLETDDMPAIRVMHRRPTKRETKAALARELVAEIMPALPDPGVSVHIVGDGRFDYWLWVPDLLELLAAPADFWGSTWTMNRQNALGLLARYRNRLCTFNDDVQGTAAVALAGLYSAARVTGVPLLEQRLLFLGAGSAATGIADLVVGAMVREGLGESEARRRCWFVDSKGLVVAGRSDLQPHKRPYAHPHPPTGSLLGAIQALQPTALLGLSTQCGAFSGEICATSSAK